MQDTQFKNQLIDIDLEGKTLPAVTSADEGKVLTVDSSGSWTATEGGGGSVMMVNELDGALDKTWQEITDVLSSSVVIIIVAFENNILPAYVIGSQFDGENYNIYAFGYDMPETGIVYTASSASGYPRLLD